MSFNINISNPMINIPKGSYSNGIDLFLIYHNKIEYINLETKNKMTIIEDTLTYPTFSIYNNCIYYLDSNFLIHKFNFTTNENQIILNKPVSSFTLIENKVYFIDLKENHLGILENIDNYKYTSIKNVHYFYVQDNNIFYVDQKNMNPYIYNLNSRKQSKLTDIKMYTFYIKKGFIYYSYYDSSTSEIKINKTELNETT